MKLALIVFLTITSFFLQAQCCKPIALNVAGRCTGSSSCTACKNCSRCAHCSNGGTCGVCSGGRNYVTPSNSSSKKSSNNKSSGNGSYRPSSKPVYVSTPTISIGGAASVSSTTLNIRKGPGTNYPVVYALDSGDEIEILNKPINGWIKIKYMYYSIGQLKTVEGYVMVKYLNF
jgi:hypothetical protein